MDRVGAYNQRSSAYNMCGANEDDVVEPQRTRRSRRPPARVRRSTIRGRRLPVDGAFAEIAVRLMMRRRDDHVEGGGGVASTRMSSPPTHT